QLGKTQRSRCVNSKGGWWKIFYQRSIADTQEAKRKAFERARKDLVEKGFLEVKDDIYTLKIHDAGQTGHDPDS
ncbi:MAG: hypothetical protein ACO20X_04255, partial [Alphaproteobacteria bacterium]